MQKSKSLIYNMLLTIGIVVGVGIFFKNQSIIAATHGNSTLIIVGWTIGSIIATASAVSFSLLAFKIKDSDNNSAEFVRFSFGAKSGNFAKWSFILVYYPLYLYTISLFTTIQLFDLVNILPSLQLYSFYLFLVAFLLIIFLIFINIFSQKISEFFNISTTFIKLIPFALLVIIALAAIFQDNPFAYWNGNPQIDYETLDPSFSQQTSSMSNLAIIFWIIPAINFAFDGFLAVSANKRSSTPKSLAGGITIGMVIVSIIFILTTVAVLKEGVSSIPETIVSFLGGDINNLQGIYLVINKILILIIVISGLGSMNGFINMWSRMAKQINEDYNKSKTGILILLIGLVISCLPWVITTLLIKYLNWGTVNAQGTDVLDEVSNIVLLLSSTLNAFILTKILYYQYKKRIKMSWVFTFFSLIAIIGIALTALWKIIDHLIIQNIMHGNEIGLFDWPKWTYPLIFALVVIQVVIAPLIGKLIIKFKKL